MTTDTALDPALDPFSGPVGDIADLVFRDARTVNTFTDGAVTDDQIRAVYDVVRWGPTALNTVPMRLLLVRTPEARERLVPHLGEGNRAKTLHAPLTLVVAADLDFHDHLDRLAPHMVGARERFAPAPEMRAAMSRDNAFLQAGYLIVGLRASGLHVGPMTGFDPAGVDAEFLADSPWRSIMIINVGSAPQEREGLGTPAVHPRQTRLDFDEVTRTV
ncbi:malonic semialdehyde reductase [Cellulomonas hominis]